MAAARRAPIARRACLARFRDMIDRRVPIVGGGAGTGLSAKWEEAGGIDLIVIYNSGRYRMAGVVRWPGCSPTATPTRSSSTWRARCCPSCAHTPVLAGVNGTDPFYLPAPFLPELAAAGLRRGAELPDRRADRRRVPAEPRRDRDGLRARGRHDRHRPRARPADHAVRVQRRRRRGDDRGRRRHHRVPHGSHDRRQHRGRDRARRSTTASTDSTSGRPPRARCGPTSSCSATAVRSPSPPTPSTCSSAPTAARVLRRVEHGAPARRAGLKSQTEEFKAVRF